MPAAGDEIGDAAASEIGSVTGTDAPSDMPARALRLHVAIVETSPNAVVAIDGTGSIIYANPQVAVTFGYDRDELIGRPVEVLLPERVADRHVGHRNDFLARPLARPVGIGADLAGRRRDGTEFPACRGRGRGHDPAGAALNHVARAGWRGYATLTP